MIFVKLRTNLCYKIIYIFMEDEKYRLPENNLRATIHYYENRDVFDTHGKSST